MTNHVLQCVEIYKYPFYVIKEDLSIIPIHDETDLYKRLYCENIQYNSSNCTLISDKKFSIYNPCGPVIHKSEIEKL